MTTCGASAAWLAPAELTFRLLLATLPASPRLDGQIDPSGSMHNTRRRQRYRMRMKQRVVFVDVDDTLIRSVGQKRIPMPAVVARVRAMQAEGTVLYLWSSGGGEYARASAVELGIEHCFVAFLPKPDAYLDDQPVHEWRFCAHVLPSNAGDA